VASVLIYDLLYNHLVAAHAPISVYHWDQLDPILKKQPRQFIVLEELGGFEEPMSIGDQSSACVRETSNFRIYAMVLAPQSSSVARQLAGAVHADLRFRYLSMDVRVLEANPPEPELLNDGLWTSYGVDVSLTADRHLPRP
jgi:hypothetical protein